MRVFCVLSVAATLLVTTAGTARAVHTDIEFSYESGMVAVAFGPEGYVFEGDFSDFPNPYSTDDPGYGSEVSEGFGIDPSDVIAFNVVGPLLYHNGTAFAATSETFTFHDALGSDVDVMSSTLSGFGYVGQASGTGDFHEHIDYSITTTAPVGAYGVPITLSALNSSLAPKGIADSLEFYLVFNRGLDSEEFETAVSDFAVAVPEPGTGLLLFIGGALCGLAVWKRKRNLSPVS